MAAGSVGFRPLVRFAFVCCLLLSSSGGAEAVRWGGLKEGKPLPTIAANEMGFLFGAVANAAADVIPLAFVAPLLSVE